MFDIAFSELVIIAVVALVVIGPERLPTVARTVGALLGRLNRYVSDVKADVEREMRLEEMKKLRAEVEAQASGLEQQVVRELEETRAVAEKPFADALQSVDPAAIEAAAIPDGQVEGVQKVPAERAPATGDAVAENSSSPKQGATEAAKS